MQSQGSVEQYLHENESIEQSVKVETATVYVTNQRVLAMTPTIEGKNFQQAERPNVSGVEVGIAEDRSRLWNGAQYAVMGGLLTPVGFVVDFGSIFGDLELDSQGSSQFGAEGLISAADTLITVMTYLSYAIIAIGLVLLAYGVFRIAQYWEDRQQTLELVVAGDGENISLPVPEGPDGADEAQFHLRQALFPGVDHDDPTAQDDPTAAEADWS